MESTAPSSREKLMPFSTSRVPKFFSRFFTSKIAIPYLLYPEIVHLPLQIPQQQGKGSHEGQEEQAGGEQGPDQALGGILLGHHDDLLAGDDPGQGGILHQSDHLVAHGGNDAFDHLEQGHFEEDLGLGKAQHLTGLILAFGDGLDAAPVDLGKIAGIVDDKGHRSRSKAAV